MSTRPRRMSLLTAAAASLWLMGAAAAQSDSLAPPSTIPGAPVILSGDTLFHIKGRLGPFTADQRASALNERLAAMVQGAIIESLLVIDSPTWSAIAADTVTLMAVSDEDATLAATDRAALARSYAEILQSRLRAEIEKYSTRSILVSAGIAMGLLLAILLIFWAMMQVFPRVYSRLESWEGTVIRPIRFRSHELLSAGSISAMFIVLAKGLRLAISLALIYFFITYALALFPWTARWNVKPVLIGIFLSILTTTAALVLFRAVNSFFAMLIRKIAGWKGTIIKPVRLKTVEVLSQDRIAELLEGVFRLLKLVFLATLGYFYVTLLFSFFPFTQTWAGTLFGYILNPLWNVLSAAVRYLPNLFFILVITAVTRFVIKFAKLAFDEIGKGVLTLPGFYREWADPTYKIVRFLILAFATIVIFPYLPGSDSPVFQGVSVFLGILFSLGSTSAIANIVAGIVLTYMRPFTVGDRVKIADTVGDITEKTLLVTRVRTVKNVDVTIPNAMVLGSHIINFSSSAKQRGLILHTGVTIGYDVPWKKVHELLLAAAAATPAVLKEPKPFVLQTSLEDSYVRYELNAYTDKPNAMATVYSELHQRIQDAFNEAGVEIMSPHYAAVRDGNQTTIPETYLPASYQAPSFRLFPVAGNTPPKPAQ